MKVASDGTVSVFASGAPFIYNVGVYIVCDTRAGPNLAVGFPQFSTLRLTYTQVTTRDI